MAIKSVTVFIDQFSDRIFDLGHDNIHLYDYGNFHETVWTDNYYNVSTGAFQVTFRMMTRILAEQTASEVFI